MNRRETLMTMIGGLGVVSASGCAVAQLADARMVVDDGVSEITPVYVMTYTEGHSTVFVRADFYFFNDKKQVKLRDDGAIKVNGILLGKDPKELISYIADVPAAEVLTFEFVRSAGNVQRHSFTLPELHIVELPQQYAGVDPVRVPLLPGEVRNGVTEDSYLMTIYGRKGETRLKGERTSQSEISFRSVQYSASPPGSYRARIFRQQRTPLKNISDSKTGWAVATRGYNFMIEVVQ